MKKHLLVVVLALFGVLTGCGDASFPYLTSVAVMPANPSVVAGNTQQFTVQGTFSNGSTSTVSSLMTAWTSSNLSVASINSSGLATTYAPGTTTITASVSSITGILTASTTLTVTTPTLSSIVVTDLSAVIAEPTSVGTFTIAVRTTHQFVAYGIYSDGGERALPNSITTSVTWTSSPTTIATITNTGLATGVGVGSATITATDPSTSISGTATLNVTSATVSTIVVAPAAQTIAPLTDLVYTAVGMFSDGTTQDVTDDVSWSSSNTGVATIGVHPLPVNVAAGVAAGTTTITAAIGSVSGSQTLTVSSATLSKITITPASSSSAPFGMAVNATLQLIAVGTFSDGTTQTINSVVGWTSNNTADATVSTTGLVTGVAVGGPVTVTAKFGTVTQSAFINVENVTGLVIGPSSTTPIAPTAVTIAQGTATEFSAIATLTDGSTPDVTSSVTWVSTAPTIATVSNASGSAGWATGIAPGTTTIAASFDGAFASDGLTVTNATLSSLAIATPTSPATIALGATQAYTVTGTFSDSSTQDLSTQVLWTSSDIGVAIISQYGVATSTGTGTTTITAAGNINGSMESATQTLTVVP